MFSMFYMTFNFAVQVTTVTDVPGDTAESAFVNITTHPPGQWHAFGERLKHRSGLSL